MDVGTNVEERCRADTGLATLPPADLIGHIINHVHVLDLRWLKTISLQWSTAFRARVRQLLDSLTEAQRQALAQLQGKAMSRSAASSAASKPRS